MSNIRGVEWYFFLFINFNRTLCKQNSEDSDQTPDYAVSNQAPHCLTMPHPPPPPPKKKMDARLTCFKVSGYDQERPQSHTVDQLTAP